MPYVYCTLTHWGIVTHLCVTELGHHWLRQWIIAYVAPNCYPNKWWLIVNWILRSKIQWSLKQTKIFYSIKYIIKCSMQSPVHRRPTINPMEYGSRVIWVYCCPVDFNLTGFDTARNLLASGVIKTAIKHCIEPTAPMCLCMNCFLVGFRDAMESPWNSKPTWKKWIIWKISKQNQKKAKREQFL